jgi:hypothetical protein
LAGLQREIEHAAAQENDARLEHGATTMQRIPILIGVVIGLPVSLLGCAKSSAPSAFRLGMPIMAEAAVASEDLNAQTVEEHPELRHVTSNKVLGAMAFQKTTGRTVDPQRLTGSR